MPRCACTLSLSRDARKCKQEELLVHLTSDRMCVPPLPPTAGPTNTRTEPCTDADVYCDNEGIVAGNKGNCRCDCQSIQGQQWGGKRCDIRVRTCEFIHDSSQCEAIEGPEGGQACKWRDKTTPMCYNDPDFLIEPCM